jgi:HAD superfamily hydrolase (TIGR01509 family)
MCAADSAIGAIWDLDGTLVDTEMAHFAAWRALLREHGRDLTLEQFKPTFGLRNDDILLQYFGFRGDAGYISALSERKEELFRADMQANGVRLLPGARELVEHFHALGARQAIASSAPPRNIEVLVGLLDVADRFSAVVSGLEVVHGKPAPDIMLRAAERLGLPATCCTVLEDAPAGIAAGKAAGCRTVAILSTFERPQLQEADLIVESFQEVLWPRERWQAFVGC